MDKNFKILAILSITVLGIMSTFTGATYALFSVSSTAGANVIEGKTFNNIVSITMTPRTSGKLIPMKDSLLTTALSKENVCVDSRGYTACALYQITLNNTGEIQNVSGYLTSLNGTTFTAGDLKYQLFTKENNTYTAVTDMMTVDNGDNYFKFNNTNINFTLAAAATTDYYLAIWISDNDNNQPLTQNKKFIGSVTFVSILGGRVSANFNI